jgi:nucleoside-diphosphate-sugar epimerase
VVIHLGATFQFGPAARRVAEETNVRGTEHLLEAAEHSGVERFVYVSSSGVLEGGPGLLTERDFPSQVPDMSPIAARNGSANSPHWRPRNAAFR